MRDNKNNNSKNNNFKTKKALGQCFLTDERICAKIADLADIKENDVVLEVGPGLGAITKYLIKKAKKVYAFEIDNEAIPILEKNTNFSDILTIYNEDILKTDLSFLDNIEEEVILVSNLPYYITSPIISLFLYNVKKVKRMVLMVQKEVGDRLSAKVSTKDYNSFTIIVNYFSKVTKLLNVSRGSFTPSPNVDSVVIEIDKIERDIKPLDEDLFIKIVNQSFKERRKTILNNLQSLYTKEKTTLILEKAMIDPSRRAETLSIDEFINLSNVIKNEF